MNIDIKKELHKIIINDNIIGKSFNKKHPNTKYSLDIIIDEIIYMLKSGVSLRNLRSPVNYKTINRYFNIFVKNNIFLKLFKSIRNKYFTSFNNNTLFIDSTIIYNKFGVNKLGRNKFYKNKRSTKISLMTDINGFPFSVFFMKGNRHDIKLFDKHVNDIKIILPKKSTQSWLIKDTLLMLIINYLMN